MADPIDIAATVGTWVAVGLALVALIGIVTPYLILRAARSDRYQALDVVDSGKTGYVQDSWKLTRSIRFRTVRVPILTASPVQTGSPSLKETINGDGQQGLLPMSTTGWVNFAFLTTHYANIAKFDDTLLIRQREAWLPVHRFFILGVGLRGRYGHRHDRGEQISIRTTARLPTEEPNRTDEELWRYSTTTGKLYGITGTIWWRQSLNSNETRFDETYYATHLDPVSEAYIADPTPLDELFWLAIGCLPIKNQQGRISRVYDLTYESRRPIRSTRDPNQAVTVDTATFQARSSLNARHREWAAAVGATSIKPQDVFYLDMDHITAQQGRNVIRIPAADVEKMAVGVLRLSLSPHGFLLPEGKHISVFFPHMRTHHLRNGTETENDMSRLFALSLREVATEHGLSDALRGLRENIQRYQNSSFSRERAKLCSELDSSISTALGTKGPGLWAVAVLSLTNARFFRRMIRDLMTVQETQVVDIQVPQTSVRVGGVEYSLGVEGWDITPPALPNAANEVHQPDRAPRPADQGVELGEVHPNTRHRVILTLLWACVRMIAADNHLDSKPLLEMVNRMADIVHVSSRTSAPIIHASIEAQVDGVGAGTEPEQRAPPQGGEDGNEGGAGRDGRLTEDNLRRHAMTRPDTEGGGRTGLRVGFQGRGPIQAPRPTTRSDSGASSRTTDTDNPIVYSRSPSELGEEDRAEGTEALRGEHGDTQS